MWQLPPGQYPSNASWILSVRLRARATGITLCRDFQIQPSAAEGRRETTHTVMAEWNDPPRAGEQQQNQTLTKEEVISCLRMQLWSMGSPACSTNSIPQPGWKCDPVAREGHNTVVRQKAAYPWLTPALDVSGAAAPQLCHSCPWLSALTSAPTRPNQLWGILWAESWAKGLAPSSLWEYGAGMGVQQLLIPTRDENLQSGGGDSHRLPWLWISLHSECTCSCAVCSAWIYCFLCHWSYICLSLQCL